MNWHQFLVDEVEKRLRRGKSIRGPRGHQMHLVPRDEVSPENRPPLLPGRKSRRPRKNVWVPK